MISIPGSLSFAKPVGDDVICPCKICGGRQIRVPRSIHSINVQSISTPIFIRSEFFLRPTKQEAQLGKDEIFYVLRTCFPRYFTLPFVGEEKLARTRTRIKVLSLLLSETINFSYNVFYTYINSMGEAASLTTELDALRGKKSPGTILIHSGVFCFTPRRPQVPPYLRTILNFNFRYLWGGEKRQACIVFPVSRVFFFALFWLVPRLSTRFSSPAETATCFVGYRIFFRN